MSELNKSQIEDLINRFTDGFNRDDLDFVMEFFTEDATYVEFNGKQNHGKHEIREAFEPQFRGDFGKMRFKDKEFFIDEQSGKALFNWWCIIEIDGKTQKCDGLDIFNFEDGLIKKKRTYFLCEMPKFIDG